MIGKSLASILKQSGNTMSATLTTFRKHLFKKVLVFLSQLPYKLTLEEGLIVVLRRAIGQD